MKYLCLNKHWPIDEEYNLDKLLYLMIDRPNKINNNDFIWLNNKGYYHRDYDLPSYIWWYNDGIYELNWLKNGKRHRENNKPSYIKNNSYKEYYMNNKFIKNEYLK